LRQLSFIILSFVDPDSHHIFYFTCIIHAAVYVAHEMLNHLYLSYYYTIQARNFKLRG
jgi:hypothetical protein